MDNLKTTFGEFINENLDEIKMNIISGENQIVNCYRGSDYNPKDWKFKNAGQLGLGIYFSSSLSKASGYGIPYICELKLINPVLAYDTISFKQIREIFYNATELNITDRNKYKKYCNDNIFFEEERSWREIGEDIGRCTNVKYQKILFSKLSNFTGAICTPDGFEICLLDKVNIINAKLL